MIIDGKKLASELQKELKEKVERLKTPPTLSIVLVGKDPASQIYVKAKKKACENTGINCEIIEFDEEVNEGEIQNKIKELNEDEKVSGIIVQLPLPEKYDKSKIINMIEPEKDVDGLTERSLYIPATAKAVLRILEQLQIDLKGRKAAVIGRSKLVGGPVADLLEGKGCNVIVCHSKTTDLKAKTINADILVSAVGKKNLVTKDMVKKGAVVIDVGITREGKRLYGDVSEDAKDVAGYITPVPGGVGPMTVACLLENVISRS